MVIGSSRYFTCHPYLENIGNRTILLGNWKDLLAAVSSWWETNVAKCFPGNVILIVPIGSMYGIYLPTCVLIFMVNVGKYHITGILWDILILPIYKDPSPFWLLIQLILNSSPLLGPKKNSPPFPNASQTVRRKGGSVGIPNRGASGLANGDLYTWLMVPWWPKSPKDRVVQFPFQMAELYGGFFNGGDPHFLTGMILQVGNWHVPRPRKKENPSSEVLWEEAACLVPRKIQNHSKSLKLTASLPLNIED